MFRESTPISPENYHRPKPLDSAINILGETLVEASQMGTMLTPEIAQQRAERFVRELLGGLAEEMRLEAELGTDSPASRMSHGDHGSARSAALDSTARVLKDLSEGKSRQR